MINEPTSSPLFVCGIIGDSTAMVLNKCLIGPFKNRYDLVTTPVTTRATLSESVSQMAQLQTGLQTVISKQLGTVQLTIPALAALELPTTLINIYYLLEPVGGQLLHDRPHYTEAVSAGAARVPFDQLNWANSSPSVMQAKRFLQTGAFPTAEQRIDGYQVLEQAQF
ncbi:hypothetical protein N644_1175 [Lactiplantibacillus paraplantarum]|uniref:hypothetical protein n=1 Tax=Lactiplantibacillus paraplantarum TaxID=60520 RepID=UPI0003ADE367|nr:hypothetical protein [Lactiplantibacillus paraplantarum]ERL44713.1 hypothetical protein N644_1175 [Lactiplantibacillus paraplantarum]